MHAFRVLHKWLGLIVGLQLLLWTVSGLAFAFLGHEEVSGERSLRAAPTATLDGSPALVEPSTWLGEYAGAEIRDIRLVPLLDSWLYRIHVDDRVELRRADDGVPFVIGEREIRALATARYAGEGALERVRLHAQPSFEARDAGPVWEAAFGDERRTTLYFSADDGRLVATRNDTWRLFDIFWMLHTMDYRGRDDFNNWLVILFGTTALWLGVSGGVLLYRVFRPRRMVPPRAQAGP